MTKPSECDKYKYPVRLLDELTNVASRASLITKNGLLNSLLALGSLNSPFFTLADLGSRSSSPLALHWLRRYLLDLGRMENVELSRDDSVGLVRKVNVVAVAQNKRNKSELDIRVESQYHVPSFAFLFCRRLNDEYAYDEVEEVSNETALSGEETRERSYRFTFDEERFSRVIDGLKSVASSHVAPIDDVINQVQISQSESLIEDYTKMESATHDSIRQVAREVRRWIVSPPEEGDIDIIGRLSNGEEAHLKLATDTDTYYYHAIPQRTQADNFVRRLPEDDTIDLRASWHRESSGRTYSFVTDHDYFRTAQQLRLTSSFVSGAPNYRILIPANPPQMRDWITSSSEIRSENLDRVLMLDSMRPIFERVMADLLAEVMVRASVEQGKLHIYNRVSAGLVVDQGRLLVVQLSKGPVKGWWGLPAGYLQASDRNPHDRARADILDNMTPATKRQYKLRKINGEIDLGRLLYPLEGTFIPTELHVYEFRVWPNPQEPLDKIIPETRYVRWCTPAELLGIRQLLPYFADLVERRFGEHEIAEQLKSNAAELGMSDTRETATKESNEFLKEAGAYHNMWGKLKDLVLEEGASQQWS